MTDQQAGSNPPENTSYDADLMADIRGAYTEVATEAPAEVVKDAALEAKVEVAPEAKADHPTDDKRYADGTFKPVKGDEKAPEVNADSKPAAEAPKPPEVQSPPPDQQQAAPVAGTPPGGFSIKTKSDWDKIAAQFPHLVADIAKREKEVNDGFSQYEGMRELRPYHEQARQQGQSLKQVLDNFIGMESLLRQNPAQGFLTIANRIGLSPQQLAQVFAPYGQSNGQQGYLPQDQYGAQPPIDPAQFQQWLNPLSQEVTTLKSQLQQIQQAETTRFSTAFSAAQARFVAEPAHRYYENVKPQMAQLFQAGILQETGDHYADLKSAYDMACNMHPEIRETLLNERIAKTEEQRRTAEKEAAEKALKASRSITGSPAAGAKDTSDTDDSIEAEVRRAYRAHAA